MPLDAAIQNAVRRLKLAGIDLYEVVGLLESSLLIESKKQMVTSVRRDNSRGIAIRIIRDRRLGFISTMDISPRAVEQAVSQVISLSSFVPQSDEFSLPKPVDPKEGLAEKLGRSFHEIPYEEKAAKALALESAAIAADSRISQVEHARYEEKVWTLKILNSRGVSQTSQRGLVFCELKAVAKDGSDTEAAYEFDLSPRFEDLKVEEVARSAAKMAVKKLGARPVSIGAVPVLFSPRAASCMVRLVAPSFFADNVQKNKSVIASKKGASYYDRKVTLIDDGLLPGGLNSFPFDGEGVPRRRNIMIENGAIKSWLYDFSHAVRDKTESTGSLKRTSLSAIPTIDVSNCFMKPGNTESSALLKGVTRGFYVTELAGLHTANTISGDFSLGAEGFLIENGLLSLPIRGMTIAGNIHELFRSVAGVGDDLRFYGEYGAPSILVAGLSIAGGA